MPREELCSSLNEIVPSSVMDIDAVDDTAVSDVATSCTDNSFKFRSNVDWKDLMILFQDIASLLPINCCDNKEFLIIKALEIYEEVSRWTKTIFLRLNNTIKPIDFVPDNNSPWLSISKIAKYFLVPVSPYAFMLENDLCEKLSLYIKRGLLLKNPKCVSLTSDSARNDKSARLPVMSTTSLHEIDLGVDPSLDNSFKMKSGISPHVSAAFCSNDLTLHCFCCLPESDGETNMFVQCEECLDWFHPLCINRKDLYDGAVQKASASRNVFVCGLCCHLDNSISSLTNPNSPDWFDGFLFNKPKKCQILYKEHNMQIYDISILQPSRNEKNDDYINSYNNPKHSTISCVFTNHSKQPCSEHDLLGFLVETQSHVVKNVIHDN